MSISLNRMSLELVDPEYSKRHGKKKRKIISVRDLQSKKGFESHNVSNRFRNKIDKRKNKEKPAENTNSTEANIQKLLLLSSNHINVDTAEKLFNRAVTKQSSTKSQKSEETTAFTEEDFQKFAKEYFQT